MTLLTKSARNELAKDMELRALVGRSVNWDTWIFPDAPTNVRIEGTGSSMIVIVEDGDWAAPNAHNTLLVPRLRVDIWSDPTRNPDHTVKVADAEDKILAIRRLVDKHFHLVNKSGANHMPVVWGSDAQVADGEVIVIDSCLRISGTSFSAVRDGDGAMMGSTSYGVSHL